MIDQEPNIHHNVTVFEGTRVPIHTLIHHLKAGASLDADFQVSTVSLQGWKGNQNSELLEQATVMFDVLVKMDKGFEYQQNIYS